MGPVRRVPGWPSSFHRQLFGARWAGRDRISQAIVWGRDGPVATGSHRQLFGGEMGRSRPDLTGNCWGARWAGRDRISQAIVWGRDGPVATGPYCPRRLELVGRL